MAAVSGAGAGRSADAILVVSYVVIATTLVWALVGYAIVAADRAAPLLQRSEAGVRARARELRVWVSLSFGAALVADGLLRLIA